MEFFDSIANSFKERTRSPFYGAFILAWVVCNWPIFVALIFFERTDLGELNIVEFIQKNYLNIGDALIYPLIYSLLIYIGLIPWIDYLTMWYIEWVAQKKKARKHKIQESFTVDGKEYVALLRRTEEQIKLVAEFEGKAKLANEQLSEFRKRNEQIQDVLKNSDREKEEARKKVDLYGRRKQFSDKFYGRWTMFFIGGIEIGESKQAIEIENSRVTFRDRRAKNQSIWNLQYSDMDLVQNKLVFVLRNESGTIKFLDMNIINDKRCEGVEDGRRQFVLTKDEVTAGTNKSNEN